VTINEQHCIADSGNISQAAAVQKPTGTSYF